MILLIIILLYIYLFGYLVLYKIIFFVLKTYHRLKDVKIRKNKFIQTIPVSHISFTQTYNMVIIQDVNNKNNRKYCNKHNIDYILHKGNMFQNIDYIFNNSTYKYIIYMKDSMNIIDHKKSFIRIIQCAGDVDLILCRDKNKKDINLNVIIFRKSEWSIYKLRQLYWTTNINTDLVLDQIYTNYIPLMSIKSVDEGLPYKLCNICVFNEHAFNSESSSFIQNHLNYFSIFDYVYPWYKIRNYDEISIYPQIITTPTSSNKIPKNIFQTMETSLLPSQMLDEMVKWQKLNPNYQYKYFTSLERVDFISKHFSENVIQTYDKLLPGAYKVDLWRCCVLYIYGGVYVDSRAVPLVSLDNIIDSNDKFIIPTDKLPCWLWNGFICSTPKHRLLKYIIDYICDNVQKNSYCTNTLDITGPSCVGKMMNKYLFKPENSIFIPGKKKFDIKILSLSIFSNLYVKYNGYNIIRTRAFNGITEDNFRYISGTEKYGSAWWNKRIYKNKLLIDP